MRRPEWRLLWLCLWSVCTPVACSLLSILGITLSIWILAAYFFKQKPGIILTKVVGYASAPQYCVCLYERVKRNNSRICVMPLRTLTGLTAPAQLSPGPPWPYPQCRTTCQSPWAISSCPNDATTAEAVSRAPQPCLARPWPLPSWSYLCACIPAQSWPSLGPRVLRDAHGWGCTGALSLPCHPGTGPGC